MPMRHVFILNPVSGKKNAASSLLPAIEKAAFSCGISAEYVWTKAPKHGEKIAGEMAQNGQPVRFYSVGGDGTLNEIFSGVQGFKNAQVACVPCGSGNDFVRTFGKKDDFLSIEALIAGNVAQIDLIKTEKGICAGITSTGLDADVAYNIPKYRRIPFLGGSAAYSISVLEKLLKPIGRPLYLRVDGKEIKGKFLIAAVCNTRHYGGGFNAAPLANVQDGLLDVVLVKNISRLLIASIIGQYKKGLHVQNGQVAPHLRPYLSYVKAKEVYIEAQDKTPMVVNIDGECAPKNALWAQVLPKAAQFVLPKALEWIAAQ